MSDREVSPESTGLPVNPVDPFDRQWEAGIRRNMEPTGWDATLAVAAARDALAVVRGDLSAEEFQERHHAAYLKEFGVDLRPGADAPPAPDPTDARQDVVELLPVVAPETPPCAATSARRGLSRRGAIGLAGGALATFVVSDWLGAYARSAEADSGSGASAGGSSGNGGNTTGHTGHGGTSGAAVAASSDGYTPGKKGMQMGMVVDLEKCDGCLMCVNACKKAYGLPDGVHWIYVLAYKEPDRPDNTNLLVRTCQHCSNAPCVKVCPTGARHRREDGLVLTDYDVCFGCRYCQVACPYGVNYFGWDDPKDAGGGFKGERKDARGVSVVGAPPRGVMGKCIFCPGRMDSPHQHTSTHCSAACPMGVLHYGDLNDPESEPNRYLRQRIADSGGKLSTFRLLDSLGTKPNVIFIGHQPSPEAKSTDGPMRYEDWGLVHHRRIVLDGPEPWFDKFVGR